MSTEKPETKSEEKPEKKEPDRKELRAYTPEEVQAYGDVLKEEMAFALAQRRAKVYANSSLVPKEYQDNIGNVLIAENMARRMSADILMVMQNLYVVNGRPGWSSQFLIATFNSCGRFTAVKYKFSGEGEDFGCMAFTKEKETGEVVEGPKVTKKMAHLEGWIEKKGSKWKTMPDLMFRYRAAAFLIRLTAPEIGMGLLTKEELEDMEHRPSKRPTESDVIQRLSASMDDEINQLDDMVVDADGEVIDVSGDKAGEPSEESMKEFDRLSLLIEGIQNVDGANQVNLAINGSVLLDEKQKDFLIGKITNQIKSLGKRK